MLPALQLSVSHEIHIGRGDKPLAGGVLSLDVGDAARFLSDGKLGDFQWQPLASKFGRDGDADFRLIPVVEPCGCDRLAVAHDHQQADVLPFERADQPAAMRGPFDHPGVAAHRACLRIVAPAEQVAGVV